MPPQVFLSTTEATAADSMLVAGTLWQSFPSAEVGEVEASFVHGMDEDDAAYPATMLTIAGEFGSGLLGRNMWR